ncbi:MAG: hypothetical protein HZA95_00600 [Candidatus Vogelbacteria bacterium]|nr:hypothetical protein [Candidatus Vogelbacteria bacterium]
MFDIIYFTFIASLMCAMYFVVYFVAPKFFEKTSAPLAWKHTLRSLVVILVTAFIAMYLVFATPSEWWGNRIQHALGGGFVATMVCYLAVKDSKIKLSYLQFIFATLMLVSLLGVGNEVVEYLAQHFLDIISAATVDDTWLDLVSNLVGIAVGLICFTPFIRNNSEARI